MITRVVTAVTGGKPVQASQPEDYLLRACIDHCRAVGTVKVTDIMATLLVSRTEAIRFIDQMEDMGLIGQANGSGPRQFVCEVVQ